METIDPEHRPDYLKKGYDPAWVRQRICSQLGAAHRGAGLFFYANA
ncbi:hypothetical protein [Intestinimonas butyriciproducens]